MQSKETLLQEAAEMHITSLSDDLLVEIFKRLAPHSAAAVCKAFRRIYHSNATAVTLTHVYDPNHDAPVARSLALCPQLRHLDATSLQLSSGFYAQRSPWPLRGLTQLRTLTLMMDYGPAADIPPTLASIKLVGSCTWRSPQWLLALLAHLDAAGSQCKVHVDTAVGTADWEAWKHPRLRARQLTLFTSQCRDLSVLNCADLSALQALLINSCGALTTLSGLDEAKRACPAELRMYECGAVSSLEGLQWSSHFRTLTSVSITACASFSSLRGVGGLLSLQTLEVCRCSALRDLSTLAGARLTSLTRLTFDRCQNLSSLHAFSSMDLPRLKTLDFSGCNHLENVAGLGGAVLTAITGLMLEGCAGMTSLRGLGAAQLPALVELNLAGCMSLSNLDGLENAKLGALKILDLEACRQLTSILELDTAQLHEDIAILCRGCPPLHGIPSELASCIHIHDVL